MKMLFHVRKNRRTEIKCVLLLRIIMIYGIIRGVNQYENNRTETESKATLQDKEGSSGTSEQNNGFNRKGGL